MRSNYALREEARTLKGTTTAVLAHGANPGLVSHLVKQALLNIQAAVAQDAKLKTIFPPKDDLTQDQNPEEKQLSEPKTKEEWGKLANELGVKAIHIAERDTQKGATQKVVGEFVNTWSVDGFVSEGCQPSEMGWGTHERELPPKGMTHKFGCGSAIYLNQPGFFLLILLFNILQAFSLSIFNLSRCRNKSSFLDSFGRTIPRIFDHPQ